MSILRTFSSDYPALHRAVEILKARRRQVNEQDSGIVNSSGGSKSENSKCNLENTSHQIHTNFNSENPLEVNNHITFSSVRILALKQCKALYPEEKIPKVIRS